MNTVSKVFIVILALILNFIIYYCFQETIDFENETHDFGTTSSVYNGDSERVCNPDGCIRKYIYRYRVNNNGYQITSKSKSSAPEPPIGSVKLVKYDKDKPDIAFFSKMNVLYLFYLIEFVLLFVVLWVCFSKTKKVTVVVDGDVVQMEKAGPNLYFGQAIVSSIFTFICVFFYLNMANTIGTFNPIKIISLTHPAGLVLIVLLILGIFMTIWSYKTK